MHVFLVATACSQSLTVDDLLALSFFPKDFDKYLNKKVLYPPERICRMK